MNAELDHDPLTRKLDGEPHFALLGRDPLAPSFARLYAIVREKGPACEHKAREMLEAMLITNRARDPRPHKDNQHAWSARRVADQMSEWYRHNMRGTPQSGKLNVDQPQPGEASDPETHRTTSIVD